MKAGSSVPRWDCWTAAVRDCFTWPAILVLEPAPPLPKDVDCPEQQERKDEQDDRQRDGARVIIFLQPHHDEIGRNFGTKGLIARNKDDRTVFSDRSRERQRKASQHRREKRRRDERNKSAQAA